MSAKVFFVDRKKAARENLLQPYTKGMPDRSLFQKRSKMFLLRPQSGLEIDPLASHVLVLFQGQDGAGGPAIPG